MPPRKPTAEQMSTRRQREQLLAQFDFNEGSRSHTWFDTLQEPEEAGLRALGVHLMGQSVLLPPYAACRPNSQFELLMFPLAGQMRLILPSGITAIRAGEVWLIPAESASRIDVLRGTFKMVWLHFDPGSIAGHRQEAEAVRLANDARIAARMHSYFQALRWERSEPTTHSRPFCLHLYELIKIETQRILGQDSERKMPEAIQRLRQTWDDVEQIPTQPWDVQKMADHANLSPSRFYALCLQCFGMAPQDRLTQIRMNRAVGRLYSSDQKIAGIAKDAGYSTPFAFSKAFKKIFGLSPTHFRANPGKALNKEPLPVERPPDSTPPTGPA
jgi:AraC-like DNA-binding protein